MNEQQLKVWFRENWEGWMASYEPRRGGTVGIADLQILVKGRLVPIELKVGEYDGRFLRTHDVRAAQVMWHQQLLKAGGYSWFLVGVGAEKIPDHLFLFGGGRAANLQHRVEVKESEKLPLTGFSGCLHDVLAFRMGCYT